MKTNGDQQATAPVALPAEVVVWSGSLLRCIIEDRRVDISAECVESGTTVQRSGDHGIVVVPTWYAAALGFASHGRVHPRRGLRATT